MLRGGAGQKDDKGDRDGDGEPRTFRMTFLEKAGPRPYQVEECIGRAETRTAMLVHLWHRRVRETVVILEEGNTPHPR